MAALSSCFLPTNIVCAENSEQDIQSRAYQLLSAFVIFHTFLCHFMYNNTCLKRLLSKRAKIGFQDQLLLNAGQKYCRMLQAEHSAILSTFIKLPFVIKIFVLSIFEWPLLTGFTVFHLE